MYTKNWTNIIRQYPEATYKSIIDNFFANSPLAIEVIDRDGNLKYINSASLKLFGIQNPQILTKSLIFTNPHFPEDLKSQISMGDTVNFELSYDFDWINNNFSISTNNKGIIALNIQIFPILYTKENSPNLFLVQIQDISERIQIEEELRFKTYALNERVKELNCLYGVSQIVENPESNAEDILQKCVDIIPKGWQFPLKTCARICYKNLNFYSPQFKETHYRLTEELHTSGRNVGRIDIYYINDVQEENFNPFLKEEYSLIHALAESLGRFIEKKETELDLRRSLNEKEILLKEIHHRVKNNLQIISALITLEQHHIHDENTRKTFKEIQNRIKAMALIHENLYRSADLAKIDFKKYLDSLVKTLCRTYPTDPNRIQLRLNIVEIDLDLNKAILCGLIINELVSNALKYAFPDNHHGIISVSISHQAEGKILLVVQDNGVGIPFDYDIYNSNSLGLQLVHMLVSQLHGKINLQRTKGTIFEIKF